MQIERNAYIEKLKLREKNGLAKVITGIRRSGKSYLLFKLYKDYLLSKGIDHSHIIQIALDSLENERLHEKHELYNFVKSQIKDREWYYVFIDEIQFTEGFSEVINSLLHIQNIDLYVTGSNSKFLSNDILTEFRGRGDEIRVRPLSFKEFFSVYNGSEGKAWEDFYTFGALPYVATLSNDTQKREYLEYLFNSVYLKDIIERNKIKGDEELGILVDILASSVGSITNPSNLSNAFKSVRKIAITDKTLKNYIDFLQDAFLIEKCVRYDIKGKRYIDTPAKYYFTDVGLRNFRLNFRQQEENHIMENIIYNELRLRGCSVDVGCVPIFETNGDRTRKRKNLEIDFVANSGGKRFYVQSAYEMKTEEKIEQEKKSLLCAKDSFQKIIVVKDDIKTRYDEDGIITVGLYDFLLGRVEL